jgi:Endoribonuclease L-PSP
VDRSDKPLDLAGRVELLAGHRCIGCGKDPPLRGPDLGGRGRQPAAPGGHGGPVPLLDNLEQVLRQGGLGLEDVVRLNYDVTDVPAFHAVTGRVGVRLEAAGCNPASTLLGVNALAIPGLMIELEATACA